MPAKLIQMLKLTNSLGQRQSTELRLRILPATGMEWEVRRAGDDLEDMKNPPDQWRTKAPDYWCVRWWGGEGARSVGKRQFPRGCECATPCGVAWGPSS